MSKYRSGASVAFRILLATSLLMTLVAGCQPDAESPGQIANDQGVPRLPDWEASDADAQKGAAEAYQRLTRAAQGGDVWGMHFLGNLHDITEIAGNDPITRQPYREWKLQAQIEYQNLEQPQQWCPEEAHQHWMDAKLCVAHGGFQPYRHLAVHWTLEAANAGNARAMNYIAGMYSRGDGLPKSWKSAVEWWLRGRQLDDDDCMLGLERAYKHGWGVAKDESKAAELLETVIARGYPVAFVRRASEIQETLPERAFQDNVRAAELGHVDGMTNVALAYLNGRGVEKDEQQALEWARRAAAKGSASSMFTVGAIFYNGWGTDVDKEEAYKWYQKSWEHGNAEGAVRLAYRHYFGYGVPQDYEEAERWSRIAINEGHIGGHRVLAQLFTYRKSDGWRGIYHAASADFERTGQSNEEMYVSGLPDLVTEAMGKFGAGAARAAVAQGSYRPCPLCGGLGTSAMGSASIGTQNSRSRILSPCSRCSGTGYVR